MPRRSQGSRLARHGRPKPWQNRPMTVAEIRKTVLSLPEDERAALAHDLLVSLDGSTADLGADALWASEMERRAREVAEGKATLIDADDVHAELAARLRQRRDR
jgi:putative addiction module component (TIGR02574 family)